MERALECLELAYVVGRSKLVYTYSVPLLVRKVRGAGAGAGGVVEEGAAGAGIAKRAITRMVPKSAHGL